MQKAHYRFLMLKWARLHDGTYKHLYQSASYGVYNDAYDDPQKGIVKNIRQDSKTHQSQGRSYFRRNNTDTISYPVYELCTYNIYDELCKKKCRLDKRYLSKRYTKAPVKRKEQ